jgi:signal transduction histidine kinase
MAGLLVVSDAEEAPRGLRLEELISIAELQRIQDAFARATGVASVITDAAGHPITEPSNFTRLCRDIIRKTPLGLDACMRSDAELGRPNPDGPTVRPCLSCGLWDGGASIFAGGVHVANWLVGQVRNESQHESAMLAYAREIGADVAEFRRALDEVTVMSTEQFNLVSEFLFRMANLLSQQAFAHLEEQRTRALERRRRLEREELESQLRQSQKMEAVGLLAGGIAHDFNNLMTVIQGNVELLELEATAAARGGELSMLRDVRDATFRATALTRRLLAFSRRDAASPVRLDLREVLDGFHGMLARVFPPNVRLEIVHAPEPLTVFIDRNQLEQVMLNLVVNARDAISDAGLVTISTERRSIGAGEVTTSDLDVGEHAVITVRDTGAGMAPEVLERAFEPFFTTKPVGKGTGLGLSMVYGIVHQARGHVTARSELGRGTAIHVVLPLMPPDPAASP